MRLLVLMDAVKEASLSFVLHLEQSLTGTAVNARLKRNGTGMAEDVSQEVVCAFLSNRLSSSWQSKLALGAHW